MWDLSKLHAFSVVARHESVTKAARELAISQSPLSRQMMALEDELGFELFTRDKQRIRLSAAGRTFLREATDLLACAAAAQRRMTSLAEGHRGTLIVGYVAGAIHCGAVQQGLARVRAHTTDATITVQPMSSSEQAQALVNGTIDVGYAYRIAPQSKGKPGLPAKLVATDTFVVVVPRHPRWDRLDTLASVFAALPLVGGSPSTMRELIAGLASLGITPTPGVQVDDPAVVLALVAAGEGLAIVQRGLTALAPATVRTLPLPDHFRPRLRIFRTDRVGASPLTRWL